MLNRVELKDSVTNSYVQKVFRVFVWVRNGSSQLTS